MGKHINENKIENEYMEEARLKRLLQEDFEKEAQQIIKRAEADEELKDIKVPPNMYEELMEKIDAYEREQERTTLKVMGKPKKKVYLLVAAVALVAVGIGITSAGGPQYLLEKKKQEVGGREMTQLNTKDGDSIESGIQREEEFYREVEKKLGISMVKIQYLPNNTCFENGEIFEDIQKAQIQYNCNNKILTFQIKANYVESSFSFDMQGILIEEYELETELATIKIKKVLLEGTGEYEYGAEFVYQNNYYSLMGIVEKAEFEKILKNLWF